MASKQDHADGHAHDHPGGVKGWLGSVFGSHRESYQVFTGAEVLGREEFARNVLVALQSANRECERRGGIC